MHKNSVAWLIAIILPIKSCVVSLEFPMFNLSVLPQVAPSITKSIQYLYQVPKSLLSFPLYDGNKDVKSLQQPSITTIKTVNPFNLPTNLLGNLDDSLRERPQNRTLKTEPWQNEHSSSSYDIASQQIISVFNHFLQVLDKLEHKFYQASFQKLLSISPPERQENGISFAQSGLFLYLQLMALCTESDEETANQIKQVLGLHTTCAEQVDTLKNVVYSLPTTSEFVKFRWSSRLVLDPRLRSNISDEFLTNTAPMLYITLDYLNVTEDPEEITKLLNNMVEIDSGGAMRQTFEEDELSNGICAAWLTTLYLRARWRSAPTVLNGSRLFYDGDAPPRKVNMIRINDIMRYAYLIEWDAEAIEIQYAHSELTLLIILPRERSLKKLASWMSSVDLQRVYDQMLTKRLAVSLPIYTLRMTLLLPGKLRTMGITRLVNANAGNGCDSLKLSHAVQRIMFWAEAGRNAFKDDGIEWDEAPEFERILDRPYIYFVRWRNLTLLNGHFVL